ncbi:MAG: endonuclease/exonuclease/phosphatase family protein [Opitutaceae bacterium]
MRGRWRPGLLRWSLLLLGGLASAEGGDGSVRVATYNLQNYLAMDRRVDGTFRPDYPKPESEKTALRRVIRSVEPDILALQEMGPRPYLEELWRDLETEGLVYPYRVLLEAADEERHTAVLSRIPFVENRSIDLLHFRYFDGKEAVKRGLIELVFECEGERWSLFVVHLKSRYTDREDDPESGIRRVGEARAIRDVILERYPDPSAGAFMIAGDLNDTKGSRSLNALLKRGGTEISRAVPAINQWGQTWTHYYGKEEVYSRADYLPVSAASSSRVVGGRGAVRTDVAARASDHRLVWLISISRIEIPGSTAAGYCRYDNRPVGGDDPPSQRTVIGTMISLWPGAET